MNWPIVMLFAASTIAAAGFIAIAIVHFGPHPKDLELIQRKLASEAMALMSARRSYREWRYCEIGT